MLAKKISKSLSRHRAKKIWEEYYKACILPGMHLHHLDGNAYNNELSNLTICTPGEHKEYHKQLGHKIQPNFIAKANFFAEMSLEKQTEFRVKAREYAKRRTNLTRSAESILKQKHSNTYLSNSLEMIEIKTGKIIAEFSSVKDAAQALGIQRAHIRRVIVGERNSWRGHVFKYKNFRNAG